LAVNKAIKVYLFHIFFTTNGNKCIKFSHMAHISTEIPQMEHVTSSRDSFKPTYKMVHKVSCQKQLNSKLQCSFCTFLSDVCYVAKCFSVISLTVKRTLSIITIVNDNHDVSEAMFKTL